MWPGRRAKAYGTLEKPAQGPPAMCQASPLCKALKCSWLEGWRRNALTPVSNLSPILCEGAQ